MKIKFFFVALFAVVSLSLSAQNYMGAEQAITTLEQEIKVLESAFDAATSSSSFGTSVTTTGTNDNSAETGRKLRSATLVLSSLTASKDVAASLLDARNQFIQRSQLTTAEIDAAINYVEELITI